MMNHPELLLGIDIGTTTLSFLLISAHSGKVIHSMTLASSSTLPGSAAQGMQDAQHITHLVLDAVASLHEAFPAICAIGVTGQMHGVLCLNEEGSAVSPLYTWQSQLADSQICAEIHQKTGYSVHPGYGHATLYALARSHALHPQAVQYCTIMDYIVMQLTGRKAPLMHSTNAASLGLWDLETGAFDPQALDQLSLSPLRTPETSCCNRTAGFYKGIPVSIAIGDNQASFFGSVSDEMHSLLLNYGTGSQLSFVCASPDTLGGEIRPYIGNQYLLCRSALCGGRAYAMLEKFFSSFTVQAGGMYAPQYDLLNALAEEAYESRTRLSVRTQFCGTREDPSLRGSITGIGEDNFTPGALALGVLEGMAQELREGFDPAAHSHLCRAVASGNAVRRNPVLRRVLSDAFAMPLQLPIQLEEAALGAALFGGICAGIITCQQAKTMIRYEPA